MSVSQKEYAALWEEDFDIDYDEFVENRVRTDGPISFSDLKKELENERRYDSFTDPEEVRLKDSSRLKEEFERLRKRNSEGELEGEIAASYDEGDLHLRFMDGSEIHSPGDEPYTLE